MSVDDIDDLPEIPELPDPDEEPEPEEMVPLFKMGETIYEMPAMVPAGLALEYLERQADPKQGPDAAGLWLVREILGDDTYELLKTHPKIDFDQFNAIFDRLEQHVLGAGKGSAAGKKNRGRSGVRPRPASRPSAPKKSRGS